MPRVHEVKKARASKKERKCRACGHEIQPGETYRYADQRISYPGFASIRKFWCEKHRPDKYEFIQNPKLEALMRAEDDLHESLSGEFTAEEAEAVFVSAGEAVQEIADMMRESAENIREGFGHDTCQSDEFEDKASELEDAAERLSTASSEFPPEPEPEEPEDAERWEEEDAEGEWERWRDEIRDLASEMISEVEL